MKIDTRPSIADKAWVLIGNGVAVNPKVFFKDCWSAMDHYFVVADFEVSDTFQNGGELMEIAALRVDTHGAVVSEFNTLIRIEGDLAGINWDDPRLTKASLDQVGIPLLTALSEFDQFVQGAPIFVHAVEFDRIFLDTAYAKVGFKFSSKLHDIVHFHKFLWDFDSALTVKNFAMHVGKPFTGTTLMDSARAILDIFLASRVESDSVAWYLREMVREETT